MFASIGITRRFARRRPRWPKVRCAAGARPHDDAAARGGVRLLVVTRYLQRDLFDSIRAAVIPDGVVVYETFTVHQRALGWGPTSPAHLLEPGELRARFDGFDILFYEEVIEPEAVARLVARRPG